MTQSLALKHYEESASLLRRLDDPLRLAHTIRHLGLVHEDADRLDDAEECYDEALRIYREYATDDDMDYANAVRYAASIKERLRKADESRGLWQEAEQRYRTQGIDAGVKEAEDHLRSFLTSRDGN
jgi:tetratricopeptide (TPR) repeat protein